MPVAAYIALAKLLALEAHQHARAGRVDAALQASLVAIELGHRLESADGVTLLAAMVGLTMKNTGSEAIRACLPRLSLTPAVAQRTADALDELRTDPESWARMWAAEYQFIKGTLATSVRAHDLWALEPEIPLNALQFFPGSYVYQPNRTLALFGEYYRAAQRVSALPCAQIDDRMRVPTPWKQLKSLDRNAVGEILYSTAIPKLRPFVERRCFTDTNLAATQALLVDSPGSQILDHRGKVPCRECRDVIRKLTYAVRF
jgi:hypothetical protein